MTNQARLWPEGEMFTRKVIVPTEDSAVPVEVTYIVPAFDVLVEMVQNKDPGKNYDYLLQLIVEWDKVRGDMIDLILKSYILTCPGAYHTLIGAWYEYISERIKSIEGSFPVYSQTIN